MVLNRVSTYFSDSKRWLVEKLSRKTFYPSLKGLCCISISPQELTLVYARDVAGKTTIELCESHPYQKNNFVTVLTTLVKNNNLKNVACSLMLQPEDYQLLITDALPVTPAEFQAAIRWKIKDLIRFPLDDVVIDSFLMPKMKTSQNKIMVVVAQTSKMKLLSDQIHSCGLNVKYIDIPELGLRNINVLYAQGDNTTALIYVQESTTQLLISSQQEIYVSRNVKSSLNTEDANAMTQGIDRLASELQRSFHYYQSLWDQPIPSRVIFSSTKPMGKEVTELLSQKVKAPVELINIMDTLVCKPKISFAQQGKYLPVIGGALREYEK